MGFEEPAAALAELIFLSFRVEGEADAVGVEGAARKLPGLRILLAAPVQPDPTELRRADAGAEIVEAEAPCPSLPSPGVELVAAAFVVLVAVPPKTVLL